MQWMLPFCISVLVVLGKHQTRAASTCIKCTNCTNVTGFEGSEQCNLGCAIWKNDNGVVERGCNSGSSAEAVILNICFQFRCNSAPVSVCQQCSSLEDCEDFVCDKLEDDCYVRKTDELRGCTSDGIDTSSEDVQTCSTNNCNRVARCIICNSDNGDVTCLEDPDSFSKPCEGHGLVAEDDYCYRYEVNKEQFQLGCTTAQDAPTNCDANVNVCKKCGTDDCNQREFQSCYDCDNCKTIGDSDTSNCADYDSTCLVAYDLTTKQTSRKCTDGLPPNTYGEIFYECQESNCNNFEFPTHRQCYQNDDLDMSYCTSLNATRCFIQESADGSTLNRGCDTDPGFDDCHEFENCLVCDWDGCNKDATAVQVKCAICTNAEECKNPEQKECNQAKFYDGCYMYQGTDGTLEKGCLNELDPPSEAYQACTANEASCQRCTGESCNEMHCLECDSRNGAKCVAGEGNVQYGFCLTEDKCRTFVDDEGYTIRGCSSKFQDRPCDNDESCQENDGAASNGELFPKQAEKCYKCDDDCDAVKPEQLEYCTRNNDVSGCYYQFDGNNITRRGCLSEVTLDCETDPSCHECSQEEGCNSIVPWECYSCSAANGTDCVDGDAMTCKTVFNCAVYVDGDEVKRTCIGDLDFCERNPEKCDHACKEDKCNDNDICATSTSCPDGKCYEVCSDNNSNNNKPNEKCFRYQNLDELHLGCIERKPEICDTAEGHCNHCDGNFCNEAELAECFTCTTDCSTVNDVETKHCSNPKDMCFIGIDQNEEVVRGCTGESNLANLSVIKTCSEAACNRDVIGTSCYQCKNCTQLEDISAESCDVQQFTGCYTVQNLESGTIDRGCKSDSGFVDCKENMNCAVCSEANCNTHEVRDDPLWCSTCSGQNCLDYTPAEQCKNGTGLLIDRCVTFTAFGVTSFKGCLSDGIPDKGIESDCYGTQFFCEFCDEDYCNTPDLSCFSCSTLNNRTECISNPIALEKINCTANGVCFTNVDDDGHLHRGCYYDQKAINQCDASPNCESCNRPECNVHIFPKDRISCYQCDGVGCQASELELSDLKPCLVYHEDQFCYTYATDEDTVQRGCSNDETAPECDSKPCAVCHDSGCNNQETVQPNELSCIQCSSNSACEGQAFGTTCTTDQLLGRSDQCYTLFFRGLVIEKGCLSDLPNNHTCYNDSLEGSNACETCPESNCNRGMALCYKCNSKENDDCSELASASQYVANCQAECFTLVDTDGYTQRGCAEDLPDSCKNTSQCNSVTCQGKLCNDEILPEDRQRCYVCQGSHPECLIPGLVKACPRYKSKDECYTRFENSTWVQRDCLSSLEGEETCGDGCEKCSGQGCNGQLAYQLNSLSCVICEGEVCSGMVNGKQCSKQILLGRQDYCYEYTDGVTVSKGCLSDLDEGSKIKEECKNGTGGLCSLCSHKDCNGDGFDCISCDSLRNPECVEWMSPDSPGMLETCESRKCVTFIDAAGYTQKGCSNETTFCKQGDTDCFECDKSMCNNAPFPEDRLRCHQCDECNEPTADRPTACSKYSPNESCFTYVIDESISRGCLSDTELGCTGTCLTCNSNGCNNHPYEFDSLLSCIQCNSTRACLDSSKPEPCEGSIQLGNTDQCYSLMMNGEIIQKGCRRSFPECSEEEYCELCSCDGCNLVSINSKKIVCADCEGEHCGNELDTVETCEDVACISYVSKEGVVSRGCLKNYDQRCSNYGSKHETCYESQCNKNIFPSDRIKCYRCEDCGTDPGSLEICPTYLERDGCYTAFSNGGSTVSRGCISDRKATCTEPLCFPCQEEGCNDQNQLIPTTTEDPESTSTSTEAGSTSTEEGTTSDAGTSTTPEATSSTTEEGSSSSPEATSTTPEEGGSTSDGSTSTVSEESTTTTPTSACIKCAESNGIACAWGFQPNSAAQCPTDAESGCFTCRQSDGRIVRGCSSEQAQSACSSGSIVDCAGDGCNNENQRTQRCAICDSNCDGPNASYQEETCSGIVEYANRGCYLLRNERRIVTERGCVSTLGDDRKRDCENSRDQCDICFSDGCNSAMMVRVLNSLITAAIVVGVVRSKLF